MKICSHRLHLCKITGVENKTCFNLIGRHIELRIFPMINYLCILLNSALYLTLSMHVSICINFFEYVLLIKLSIFKIQVHGE